ncbi:MAG: hypothetical protein AAF677_17035 [Pseudomonadota bacterium]
MPEYIQYPLLAAALALPMWRILPRAGLNRWWALAAVAPFGIVVLLWVLGFRRWPEDGP